MAYGGDPVGMARCRQPVRHCRPDSPAREWPLRLRPRGAASNQQKHAIAAPNRPLKRVVEQGMRGGQAVSVQIDHAVRRHEPARDPAIPATVQMVRGRRRGCRRRARERCRHAPAGELRGFGLRYGWRRDGWLWLGGDGMQRAQTGGHARPKRRFACAKASAGHRALRSAVPLRRAATAQRRCRVPTCRPRSRAPHPPHPRRCQNGWGP